MDRHHEPYQTLPADEIEPRPERDPDEVRQRRLNDERASYLERVRRDARLFAQAAHDDLHRPIG